MELNPCKKKRVMESNLVTYGVFYSGFFIEPTILGFKSGLDATNGSSEPSHSFPPFLSERAGTPKTAADTRPRNPSPTSPLYSPPLPKPHRRSGPAASPPPPDPRRRAMDRIHVTVRARPLSAEDAQSSPWRISGNAVALTAQPATRFEFGEESARPPTLAPRCPRPRPPYWEVALCFVLADEIFSEECRTADVYGARTKHIVDSAVQGFNGKCSVCTTSNCDY
jgi:hypothetical protein